MSMAREDARTDGGRSATEQARHFMVESQIRPNKVTDERLLAALRQTPRELFVPEPLKPVAYIDEDIELERGRFLLEPMVFARLVQEAAVRPSDTVLDIGGGTGYSAAVLAQLASVVVALEESAALAARATALLKDLRFDNVTVVTGPLAAGHPAQAPYDVILVNGASEIELTSLTDQLAEGGRLVYVDRHQKIGKAVIVRKSGGVCGRRDVFDASVAVLPGLAAPAVFQF